MLSYKNIVLRPICAEDIDDYIRWITVETEWRNWDAPWREIDPDSFIQKRRDALNETTNTPTKLEIETNLGEHIGWLNSSCSDDNMRRRTIGIGIPSTSQRGKGYGKNALVLFMAYLFEQLPEDMLYIHTWPGNFPMIALAVKVGFAEVERIKDCHMVRGQKYNALTFSITKMDFFARHSSVRESAGY